MVWRSHTLGLKIKNWPHLPSSPPEALHLDACLCGNAQVGGCEVPGTWIKTEEVRVKWGLKGAFQNTPCRSKWDSDDRCMGQSDYFQQNKWHKYYHPHCGRKTMRLPKMTMSIKDTSLYLHLCIKSSGEMWTQSTLSPF